METKATAPPTTSVSPRNGATRAPKSTATPKKSRNNRVTTRKPVKTDTTAVPDGWRVAYFSDNSDFNGRRTTVAYTHWRKDERNLTVRYGAVIFHPNRVETLVSPQTTVAQLKAKFEEGYGFPIRYLHIFVHGERKEMADSDRLIEHLSVLRPTSDKTAFRVIGGTFRRAPWDTTSTTTGSAEDEKSSVRPFWVELYPPGCRIPTQHYEKKQHRTTAIQRGFKAPLERDIPVTEELLTRTPSGKVVIARRVLEEKLRNMLYKTGTKGRRLRASSVKKMTISTGTKPPGITAPTTTAAWTPTPPATPTTATSKFT